MFPPLLYLVLLFGLLLCFPLGIFPLPVLALKERLDFREQDTGKGLYLVIGNPCAVVIGLLSARHGITPLKLPLVEQVALKHRTVSGDETAPCILGYLIGGAGVVENNLRKHAVRPAANTEIHVVAYLTGDDGRIRPLRGKNEMDAERPSLPCDSGQLVFNLRQQLLPLVVGSGLVQHLRHLVTSEYEPWERLLRMRCDTATMTTQCHGNMSIYWKNTLHGATEIIVLMVLSVSSGQRYGNFFAFWMGAE